MQTPVRVTLDEYVKARGEFLNNKCVAWPGTGGLACAACGREIYVAEATIELHDPTLANCYATGTDFEAALPWCPHCEPKPAERGCVHG